MQSEKYSSPEQEKMSRPIILFTGVEGSGKDYLLTRVKDKFTEEDTNIPFFSFGEELFKRLKEKYPHHNLESRDDIRNNLSSTEIDSAVGDLNEWIQNDKDLKVINTHVIFKQPDGSLATSPKSIFEQRPSGFIVVTAPPEVILERRINDPSRIRAVEPIEIIKFHQQMIRRVCSEYANLLGANYLEINNREDNTEENIGAIKSFLTLKSV